MALQNLLGNIALDSSVQQVVSSTTQSKDIESRIEILTDTLVALLAAILEKMPRVTGNDQAAVSIENVPTVNLSANQTLATLSNLTQMGGQEALTAAKGQIMSGTSHIYSNILVT